MDRRHDRNGLVFDLVSGAGDLVECRTKSSSMKGEVDFAVPFFIDIRRVFCNNLFHSTKP
jgi:hypothetical protein